MLGLRVFFLFRLPLLCFIHTFLLLQFRVGLLKWSVSIVLEHEHVKFFCKTIQLLLFTEAFFPQKGDTALHIAMRARSKAIVEILLRNPKNSQLLYRPNRAGETPYNIDTNHQKSILAQIFGASK